MKRARKYMQKAISIERIYCVALGEFDDFISHWKNTILLVPEV